MRFALAKWPILSDAEQCRVEQAYIFFYQTHRGQPPMSSGEICVAFENYERRNSVGLRVIALETQCWEG